ncbi:MAG: ATP-binding protein [Eubacterium sp.]
MDFKGFIGNSRVTDSLGALIDSHRFPHAVVIEGEQGLGKKTLARCIAKALVCRGDNKPCGECSQCRKAEEGIHPDIFEYSSAQTANSFHISTVREIINDAYMQPNEAEYKVYILANAHFMNTAAQNAILKILEEPPSYAVFLLTADSKSMLLDTVLSRSVVVALEGVDANEGAKYICESLDSVDFEAAKKTIQTFNGNIGKSIDSLKDTKTAELVDACREICRALVDDSEYALLKACAIFQKDRQSIVFACELLKNIFRDALCSDASNDCISGQIESARLLKSRLTRQKLTRLVSVCDELKKAVLMNVNNSLIITKICYSLREAVGR